jgi:hypothetical protein
MVFTCRSLGRYKSWRRGLDTAGDGSSSTPLHDTLPTSTYDPASTTTTTMPRHTVSDTHRDMKLEIGHCQEVQDLEAALPYETTG